MSERTTSRVIPRLASHDSVPLLTEVVELPDEAFTEPLAEPFAEPTRQEAPVIDTAHMPDSGLVTAVGDTGDAEPISAFYDTEPPVLSEVEAFVPAEEDLRAMRTELLTRVMMRFRTEWPQVVEAHTEATLQARLAPLTAQLASELTQALEARLVEWLDATLEEIERDPGGV